MTLTAPSIDSAEGNAARPVRDVLDSYRRVVLRHPSLDRALRDVERGIAPGMPPQIVMLLGPTGVGKTTLNKAMKSRLGAAYAPVVLMTCQPGTGRRGYDFGKTHWRELAKKAEDPFRDEHVSPDVASAGLRAGLSRRDGAATIDEYRLGVLDMLRERGVGVVILDEAQHMTRAPSARSQADQLDVIKDCVDRTRIPHVLAGTYELSIMVAPSAQLARRSVVVHFPPYGPSDAADRDAFQRIFGQLVGALPIADSRASWAALSPHLADVYLGCCGCVGTLKGWLSRALQLALETAEERVDWPLMETCRLSDEALLRAADEIREYRDSKRAIRKDIEVALGMCSTSSDRKRRPSPRRKPAKRAPHRDPVGLPSEREPS